MTIEKKPLPYEICEPGVADGGGSGIRSREFDTPFGEFRAIHWSLSGGQCTSMEIGGFWPRLKLKNHIDIGLDVDLVQLYFQQLMQLGGPTIMLAFIEQLTTRAYEDGCENTRSSIRCALGIGR